jgi:hypothetical protein
MKCFASFDLTMESNPCSRTSCAEYQTILKSRIFVVTSAKHHLQNALLTYLLHRAESFLRSLNVLSYSRNSPNFMEPEGS